MLLLLSEKGALRARGRVTTASARRDDADGGHFPEDLSSAIPSIASKPTFWRDTANQRGEPILPLFCPLIR